MVTKSVPDPPMETHLTFMETFAAAVARCTIYM